MPSYVQPIYQRRDSYFGNNSKYVDLRQNHLKSSPLYNETQFPNSATNSEKLKILHEMYNRRLDGTKDVTEFKHNVALIDFPSDPKMVDSPYKPSQKLAVVDNPYVAQADRSKKELYFGEFPYQGMAFQSMLARILWAYPRKLNPEKCLVSVTKLLIGVEQDNTYTVTLETPRHSSLSTSPQETRGYNELFYKDSLDFPTFQENKHYKLLFVACSVRPFGAQIGHANCMVIHKSEDGTLLAVLFEPYGVDLTTGTCFAGRSKLCKKVKEHLPKNCKLVYATDCDDHAVGIQRIVDRDPGLCIYISLYFCILCALNPSKIGFVARKMTTGSQEEMKRRLALVLSLGMRYASMSKKDLMRLSAYFPKHLDYVAYVSASEEAPPPIYPTMSYVQNTRSSIPPPTIPSAVARNVTFQEALGASATGRPSSRRQQQRPQLSDDGLYRSAC